MEDKEKQGLFKKIGSKWAEIRENVSNKIHSAKETIKEKFTKAKTKIVVSVGGIVLAGALAITAIVSCGKNDFNKNDLNDNNNNGIQYETTIDGEIIEVITPGDNKNPGVDKPGVENSGIVTPDNGGSVQNIKKDFKTYLLNNPEYKELSQKAIDNYEFSKSPYFDNHPYSYLEKKGYDVEAIKNGSLECETVSYVIDDSLFIASKIHNTSAQTADHIFLELQPSENDLKEYKSVNRAPYLEAAHSNDAICEFYTPVKESTVKLTLATSLNYNEAYSEFGTKINNCKPFIKDFNPEAKTFDIVLVREYGDNAPSYHSSNTVEIVPSKSQIDVKFIDGRYAFPPFNFTKRTGERLIQSASVYDYSSYDWGYCTLNYQQNQ